MLPGLAITASELSDTLMLQGLRVLLHVQRYRERIDLTQPRLVCHVPPL